MLHDRAREAIPRAGRRASASTRCSPTSDYEPDALDARRPRWNARSPGRAGACIAPRTRRCSQKDEVLTQGRRAVHGVHAVPQRVAREAGRLLRRRPTRSERTRRRSHGRQRPRPLPSLEALGFERTNLAGFPVGTGMGGARALLADFAGRIDDYRNARDFPAVKGVSYLSVHNRFGTISIRELARGRARRARSEGADDLARGARVARLLLPGAVAPPARRAARRLPARVRRASLAERPGALRGLARGAHRLPAGGRRDAPDQHHRLHAQPPAHGDRVVPGEGPAGRLAPAASATSPRT